LLVAYVILRHGVWLSGDVRQQRFTADP
jgi:hypothetical protein